MAAGGGDAVSTPEQDLAEDFADIGDHHRQVCGLWLRWVAGWFAVRVLEPALMRVVQSQVWGSRWHQLTDWMVTWRKQAAAAGIVVLLVYLFGLSPVTLALLVPPTTVSLFGVGRVAYPLTARGKVRRRYTDGMAGYDEVRTTMSADAVRRLAVATRPSIADQVCGPLGWPSETALREVPATECGTFLGKVAVGMPWPECCYGPFEAVVGMIAPPRKWKTAAMDAALCDFPGAALHTQTKPESYFRTRGVRQAKARNKLIELLDPEGLTGEESTFRFSPVTGCRDPRYAQLMAATLAAAGVEVSEDNLWFAEQAATVLQFLLLIADLSGRTMVDVFRWCAGVEYASEAVALVREHEEDVPDGWVEAMIGVLETEAKKTRDSIMMTLAGSVGFMADPRVAQLCVPDINFPGFDVASFLRDRSTVYLIASERKHSKVGPLLSAFTTFFFETAKDIAAASGGRLDPPLGLFLDEVANTIPLPLPQWIADAGGRGIHIRWSAQSRSQLRSRWGRDDAETIWNATTVKMMSGGVTVKEDLDEFAALAGTRTVTTASGDERLVPVLTANDVRKIPRWHAGAVVDTADMTILRITPVWRRKDVLTTRFTPRPKRPRAELTSLTVPEQWQLETAGGR